MTADEAERWSELNVMAVPVPAASAPVRGNMIANEAERLWSELNDQRETLARVEALCSTTADSVFRLNEALNQEREQRRQQDERITHATADAIVAAVRDQLDRRAALSGSLSSTITALVLWMLFRR
jgi:predicted ATP-dependent protease